MALDERFILSPPLNQYMVDKDTGAPLSGGYIYFYRDDSRVTPKAVYQLIGTPPNYTYIPLPNPIQLSSVGTIQNAGGDNEVIYYFPYDGTPDNSNHTLDLYYIVCTNAQGVEQWTREGWPNVNAGNDPVNEETVAFNQISNPQFTNILINAGLSTIYTVSGSQQVFEFAPNWDFVINGTGTVTVQRIAISGNDNIITNPPYVIDIEISAGISSCLLRQRFNVNSGLWSSTTTREIYLSGTVLAKSQGVGTAAIKMYYEESTGGSPIEIINTVATTEYTEIKGTTASPIPSSTNTDTGNNGYVDIYLSFDASTHVRLSSVLVIPTTTLNAGNLVSYDLNSSNREEALQGDYYLPRLIAKQLPNLLTAWDFPLNPAQFGGRTQAASAIGANKSKYVWDQTIIFQSVNSGIGVTGGSSGELVSTFAATGQMAIIQYLDASAARKILQERLSVNIAAKSSIAINCCVSLWYTTNATLPSLSSNDSIVATLNANGTIASTNGVGWTQIARSGLGNAFFTVNPNATSNFDDYSFSGWDMQGSADVNAANYFAIVISTESVASTNSLSLLSVNLCNGDIPCRPASQSAEQVYNDCLYYYEKSYDSDVAPGTATRSGEILLNLGDPYVTGVGSGFVKSRSFSLQYALKRHVPVLSFYSYDGSSNSVVNCLRIDNVIQPAFSGTNPYITPIASYSFAAHTVKHVSADATDTSTIHGAVAGSVQAERLILFHYVADARLGLV